METLTILSITAIFLGIGVICGGWATLRLIRRVDDLERESRAMGREAYRAREDLRLVLGRLRALEEFLRLTGTSYKGEG